MSVPGYDQKIEFGVLIHFTYPIEGSGKFYVKLNQENKQENNNN